MHFNEKGTSKVESSQTGTIIRNAVYPRLRTQDADRMLKSGAPSAHPEGPAESTGPRRDDLIKRCGVLLEHVRQDPASASMQHSDQIYRPPPLLAFETQIERTHGSAAHGKLHPGGARAEHHNAVAGPDRVEWQRR